MKWRCLAICLLFLQAAGLCGCLTIQVSRHATAPHPAFELFGGVQAAAIRDGELFLYLEARYTDDHSSPHRPVIVTLSLADLAYAAPGAADMPQQADPEIKKAPVRITDLQAFPVNLTPVPVREVRLWSSSDLTKAVQTALPEVQVLAITPEPGGPLAQLFYGNTSVHTVFQGPVFVIIVPTNAGSQMASWNLNYEQRPRTRRAWWLLTPFSAVADILTSPVQLILALTGGC